MNIAKQYLYALGVLFSLYITDFFITKAIIAATNSIEIETNVIAYWLLVFTQNVWSLLAFKIIVFDFLALAVWLVFSRGHDVLKRRVLYALWSLSVITFVVDLWSVHVLAVVS